MKNNQSKRPFVEGAELLRPTSGTGGGEDGQVQNFRPRMHWDRRAPKQDKNKEKKEYIHSLIPQFFIDILCLREDNILPVA